MYWSYTDAGLGAQQRGRASSFTKFCRSLAPPRALELAVALDHPAYDCFYLALAELERSVLVSANRHLTTRLAGSRWLPPHGREWFDADLFRSRRLALWCPSCTLFAFRITPSWGPPGTNGERGPPRRRTLERIAKPKEDTMATTREEQRSTQSTASTQTPEKHETPKPQEEHRWLHKLVGEWTYEGEAPMKPGQAPEKFSGTETVRKIGELWVVGEGRGPMPGGEEATSVLTLGYDPQKQAFVGTWFGSMMTQLWVYEGELDAGKRKLTLSTEGPSMQQEGEVASYREVMELLDDDRRTFTSSVEGEDGSWQQMMTMTYRRKGGRTH